MLDVSVLYGGLETPSTPHRYGRKITQIEPPEHQRMAVARSAAERRPIVVWNITKRCNLKCEHCYSNSDGYKAEFEMSTEQGKKVLDQLAAFKVPAVLFSGGEPLAREDLFELAAYARSLGLHVVLSTNGTMITEDIAQKLSDLKFAYVGISLDAADPETHDQFRGMKGAFKRSLRGIRLCKQAGVKVGLRLTLTRQTAKDIDAFLDLMEQEHIDRVCFYHLVPEGRGASLDSLSHKATREAIETLFERARTTAEAGKRIEILTVDGAYDGPHLYNYMKAQGHPRTEQVLDMLRFNGGSKYSSGVGICSINWDGEVYADQFSRGRSFGSVLERDFGDIWMDESNPIMAGLKNRIPQLTGRCAGCRFKEICGGGLRARAENISGEFWAPDPQCYLTDKEICGEPILTELTVTGQSALSSPS